MTSFNLKEPFQRVSPTSRLRVEKEHAQATWRASGPLDWRRLTVPQPLCPLHKTHTLENCICEFASFFYYINQFVVYF